MRHNSVVVYAAAIALLLVGAQSHGQQPRSPTVGGLQSLQSGQAAQASRRAVMRDTLNLQFPENEVEEYREAIDGYDRSKGGVYKESARIVRRRVSVDLAPDASVPELRMNAENPGAIVFTDAMGRPWKVDDALAPGYVTARLRENMVILTPAGNQRFGRGSITVLLEGLTSTVTFSLAYGISREVDGQLEAQMQARNPNASVNAVQGASIETDEVFGLFLDGEPPKGATKVRTSQRAVEAWMYQGRLYLRTPLSIHSPAFRMYGGSAAGSNVYRFDQIPSVVNAIQDGAIVAIGIGE